MMAYHLARILHLDFGMETIAVGDESPADSNFDFDVIFSSVGIERMRETITDDDILIANPSFSDHLFGLNCRGRKVMYVQGFNTFSLLDCRFHLYVSVSEFVRRFLAGVYGIETEVIPPFIRADRLPRAPLWADRPNGPCWSRPRGTQARSSIVCAGCCRSRTLARS